MFWRKGVEQPVEAAPEKVAQPEMPKVAETAMATAETAMTPVETTETAGPAVMDVPVEPAAAEPEIAETVATETAATEPAAPDTEVAGPDFSPDIGIAQLEGRIIEAISTIYDPEIPVNIYELGLIYDLQITADHRVHVNMTLTSPACPVAGTLPGEVELKIRSVPGVRDAKIELVWDPPWDMEMMSEAAKLDLGFL